MTTSAASKAEKVLPFLHELPLLEGIAPETISAVAAESSFALYPDGQSIFSEGDPPNGGYFVATGRVVMRKSSFKGNKLTLELLGPLDPFGVVSAAKGDPYPLTGEALSAAVCLCISQVGLDMLTKAEPQLMERLLDVCAQRMQRSHRLMASLADAEATNRVAGALLVFSDKFGEQTPEGIEIEVTRQELSALAVTTVETCIRVTRSFEDQGILSFPRTKFVLVKDLPRLSALRAGK